MRPRTAAALACALAALLAPAAAPAADTPESLQREMNEALEDANEGVKDAEGRNAVSSIAAALRAFDKVAETLRELDRMNTDQDFDRQVQEWKRLNDGAKAAAEKLAELEERQTDLEDDFKKLVDTCIKTQAKLDEAIKKCLDTKDIACVKKLAEDAEKAEAVIDPAMAKRKVDVEAAEDLKAEVVRYNAPSGVYDGLEQEMEESAAGIDAAFEEEYEKVETACKELAAGEEALAIKAAIAKLKDASEKQLDKWEDVLDAYKDWSEGIAGLRKWYTADSEALRLAICKAEETKDGAIVASEIDKVANRVSTTLADKVDDIKSTADKMVKAIEALKKEGKDAELLKKMDGLTAAITKTKKSVENAAKGAAFGRGASSPKVRSQIEIGKSEHKRIQSTSMCDEDEVVTAEGRIDCVKEESGKCTIVEIKPDTESAMKKGREQVNKYQKEIVKLWANGDGAAKFTGKLAVFLKCVDKSDKTKLKLASELVTYPFCRPRWEDGEGVLGIQEVPFVP